MSEQSNRWRRAVPVAALALATGAGLVSASTAAADPLGPSGAAKGAPAPAATNLDAGCTLSPSLTQKSDRASCIGVGAVLSSVPALGQTATLTVTVKTGRVEKATAVTVELPPTLAFADGTASRATVSGTGAAQRASLATTDLAKGETRTYTRTVKAVKTGFGEIAARATAVVDRGRTDGGVDLVHLTVGKDAASTHRGAPAGQADTATVASTAKVAPLPVSRPSVAIPSPAAPSTQVATKAAAPGTSCVTGSWLFVDQAGVTHGVYQARIQVWRGGSNIASGFANGSGGYTICWASGGTTNAVYVRFVHTNNAWRVSTDSDADYAYVSSTQNVADGATYNYGGLQPSDGTQHRALHAYYDAAVMYDWMYQNSGTSTTGCWNPYGSSCRQLVVRWQNDHTGGSYWNSSGVYLGAGAPDSEDVPIHEYNHELMYDLYGSTFPATTNCNPHYLFGASSTTCAWTEGYADWAVTSVWNNTIYTYSPGVTDDFNRTWNGGDAGDQVEGRVVQALDSLNDGVKYPFDNISGPGYRTAVNFWTVMRTYKPSTFAGLWSGRASAGQDVGQASLSALFQGTIDYGFRNPLAEATPKSMPQAYVAHNYSFATTRSYWSAVAVRPADGSDSDLTLYNDSGLGTLLGSSGYGGSTTDFVAINSNSGARALQTYYPRVTRFAGTGGYTVLGVQGNTTFSQGTTTISTSSSLPINIMDSSQTSGVPVYYKAVPQNGQTLGLTFLQPGATILSRGSGVNASGSAGQTVSLVTTPTASGYGGLVLTNQALTSGTVTLYADSSAPTGTISLNGGASTVATTTVPITVSAADAQTGLVSMQISTDGTFDTEAVVPYSTSATATLKGANGTKTVYARFLNNAGIWSARVQDSVNLHAAASVTTIAPASGPTAGGTKITLTGGRFTGTTKVTVGGVDATSLVVVSDTKLTVKVPAGTAGAKTVKVFNAYGTSNSKTYTYVTAPKLFAITPSSGPATGGTVVTISGTDLNGTTSVKFGNSAGTNIVVVSSTQIKVTSPDHAAGTIDIRVTTAGGTTAVKTADRYTFT